MSQKMTFSSSKGTSSYQKYHSPKNEKTSNNIQNITLTIEKGTKRIRIQNQPIIKRITQTDRVQKLVCNTCSGKITSDVCRVLVMHDKDYNPQVFHYHFFFPCWDFELLCKRYPNLTLERAGFSIPENMSVDENAIKDLQNNLNFWK